MNLLNIDGALRWRFAVGAAVLLLGVGLLFWTSSGQNTRAEKPKLAVMTSLPLLWPEGDITAALEDKAQTLPVKQRLEQNFEIVPIDDLGQLNDGNIRLALLAQPRAFSPAELVIFNKWIDDGGGAVILADPALRWESSYPLGDSRRPLFTSMLSPLFAHWGLALTLPMEQKGAEGRVEVDSMQLQLAAYGAWQASGKTDAADCEISAQPVLATCKVGKGRALLLADADLLSAELWQGSGAGALLGMDGSENMNWLEKRLSELSE